MPLPLDSAQMAQRAGAAISHLPSTLPSLPGRGGGCLPPPFGSFSALSLVPSCRALPPERGHSCWVVHHQTEISPQHPPPSALPQVKLLLRLKNFLFPFKTQVSFLHYTLKSSLILAFSSRISALCLLSSPPYHFLMFCHLSISVPL